jgi:adenylate kinase
MKAVIVTGTPGTGKTRLAKKIARSKGFLYLDVGKLIKEKKLYDSYDEKSKCFDVDVKKLNKILIDKIKVSKKIFVIDSHLSHYLPKKYVTKCIVTKCDLRVLKKRLEKRGYSYKKVRENLDAEIFNACLTEAQENGHMTLIVDCSSPLTDAVIQKLK